MGWSPICRAAMRCNTVLTYSNIFLYYDELGRFRNNCIDLSPESHSADCEACSASNRLDTLLMFLMRCEDEDWLVHRNEGTCHLVSQHGTIM